MKARYPKAQVVALAASVFALSSFAGPFARSNEDGPFTPDAQRPGFFAPAGDLEKAVTTCRTAASTGIVWPQCRQFKVNSGGQFGATTSRDRYPRNDAGEAMRHLGADLYSELDDDYEWIFSPVTGRVAEVHTSAASWGSDAGREALSAVVIEADLAGPAGVKFYVLGHVEARVRKGQRVGSGERVARATLKYGYGHHIHLGTGTMLPTKYGRTTEMDPDNYGYVDPEVVFGLRGTSGGGTTATTSWTETARLALSAAEDRIGAARHRKEGNCHSTLAEGSKRCLMREYPASTRHKVWYVLAANADRRYVRKCEKAERSRCDIVYRW